LVVGPTGSGKSTTLAAMTNHINQTAAKHILTIEDPVEFVYQAQKCLVTQREVGRDTPNFADALKAALREDPDVILLGEMRDLETIRLALTAAETGHLVLATLHTATAPQAIERIVDVFPGEERDLARTLLADVLRAVVAQQLIARTDGTGRVAAHEILVGTPAVRNLIREDKTAQLVSVMQTGQQQGMQTMAQSLERLTQQGKISLPSESR
jgi:twitching motility protein PilT